MERDAGVAAASGWSRLLDRAGAALTDVESMHEPRVRLFVALVLGGAGLLFFREYAAEAMGASLAAGLVILAAMYIGFHQLGFRGVARVWPGASGAAATALLVGCLCPPGLPLPLVAALGGIAVLAEGFERRLAVPIALGGVLLVWPVAWLWRAQAGLPLLAPFQLRPLDEPIILWTRFQLALDPIRLYTGNVAGPLGATSFGLAAFGFLLLGYARRASWPYVVGLYLPVVVMLVATQQPLTVYVLTGQAMVLGGIVASEARKLPARWQWQGVAGILAGVVSAALLWRGMGQVAFGIGIVAAAATLSAFQLFGLTGAAATVARPSAGRQAAAAPAGPRLQPVRVALLVLITPIGLYQLWRDVSVPRPQRRTLVALGSVLYAAALAGSVTWLWLLRIPS